MIVHFVTVTVMGYLFILASDVRRRHNSQVLAYIIFAPYSQFARVVLAKLQNRHDWFYKCAIPDDMAGQQRISDLGSAQAC
jgi:hypothetical protein